MHTNEFLRQLEHERIVHAIRDAEAKTSAEIRVYIHRGELKLDPLLAAQKKFHQLGMSRTSEHNGVLIFVAPRARQFAVIGDAGIHEKCGDDYWQRVVDLMREHFSNERYTDAIVDAIGDIGEVLARHFPKTFDDPDELPDQVVEDGS
jgi:uncharacterized membrane protein